MSKMIEHKYCIEIEYRRAAPSSLRTFFYELDFAVFSAIRSYSLTLLLIRSSRCDLTRAQPEDILLVVTAYLYHFKPIFNDELQVCAELPSRQMPGIRPRSGLAHRLPALQTHWHLQRQPRKLARPVLTMQWGMADIMSAQMAHSERKRTGKENGKIAAHLSLVSVELLGKIRG